MLKAHAGREFGGTDLAEEGVGVPGAVVGIVVVDDGGETRGAVARGKMGNGGAD